ncbi:MAG: hypothetical protein P1U89_05650 [Verrucomicrobiales bacterium]|nr:hypothetical protein [Verrucomicrobiales bacterium]
MNSQSFLLLVSAFLLISCDKIPLPDTDRNANFLVGTWIIDREKTMEALKSNMVGEKVDGLAGQLAAVAIQKSAEKLITPMDNVKYTFTETEYSEKVAGYDGQIKTYEVIARPDADTIKTKDEKGVVNEYHREGLNIWYNIRGQKNLKIYLRASN